MQTQQQNIPSHSLESAPESTREQLAAIKAKLGRIPNLLGALGSSPASLSYYLNGGEALKKSNLSSPFQEQIALAVAEANRCEYCLAAHSLIGKSEGLDPEQIKLARQGRSTDPKEQAGLTFALEVVAQKGYVTPEVLAAARDAGYSDAEILELTVAVVHNIYTNYMNHVIGTVVDFPAAPPLD